MIEFKNKYGDLTCIDTNEIAAVQWNQDTHKAILFMKSGTEFTCTVNKETYETFKRNRCGG